MWWLALVVLFATVVTALMGFNCYDGVVATVFQVATFVGAAFFMITVLAAALHAGPPRH